MVKEKFDVTTARAVASLNILLEYAMPITKVNSYFIPMKGKTEDIKTYNGALKVLNSKIVDIITFKLPIENSERTIYKIEKFWSHALTLEREAWEELSKEFAQYEN